jgi:glycosyltransferase involved in cell wall biosynthesis
LISHIIFQIKLFRASKIIVQNPEDAKEFWFNRLWNKKIKIINGSGVNITFFDRSLTDKVVVRSKIGLKNDEIAFICITRLIWEKGVQEMICAFQDLQNHRNDIKLLIVGWADEDNPRHVSHSYINNFIGNESIVFMGKRDDIRELLTAADVFLYPSYYREGIPRGILEALSMSLPIITTTMPGCNLTVIENINGYLIAPKSAESIHTAVTKLVQDKHIIKEMGLKSRELAERVFSEQIIFAEIANLYK